VLKTRRTRRRVFALIELAVLLALAGVAIIPPLSALLLIFALAALLALIVALLVLLLVTVLTALLSTLLLTIAVILLVVGHVVDPLCEGLLRGAGCSDTNSNSNSLIPEGFHGCQPVTDGHLRLKAEHFPALPSCLVTK
jgi:hypothetical protein